jgi:hypothetical protein
MVAARLPPTLDLMASITVLSWISVGVGAWLSVLIARKLRPYLPLAGLLLLVVAPVLGIALLFGVGLSHMFCEHVLRFCAPPSDTSVWSVSYPLIAVPLYWVLMVFVPSSRAAREAAAQTEGRVHSDEI